MKKFFLKLFGFFKKHSRVAVEVTNLLKKAVESNEAVMLTEIIPGELDDKILIALRRVLPRVVTEMAMAHRIFQSDANINAILEAVRAELGNRTKEARAEFWAMFTGKIAFYLSDGKLSLSEGIAAGQLVYFEFYAPKAAA